MKYLLFIIATTLSAQTTTDFFVMGGSDFVRPGLATKANLNIGIGHSFQSIKNNPFGDELTFSYTYENGGSHGFIHIDYGAHTENIGLMKNFDLPHTKKFSGYLWPLIGITTLTGNKETENRLYLGYGIGLVIHLSKHNSIWLQETLNKVITFPVYTSANVGFTCSW